MEMFALLQANVQESQHVTVFPETEYDAYVTVDDEKVAEFGIPANVGVQVPLVRFEAVRLTARTALPLLLMEKRLVRELL